MPAITMPLVVLDGTLHTCSVIENDTKDKSTLTFQKVSNSRTEEPISVQIYGKDKDDQNKTSCQIVPIYASIGLQPDDSVIVLAIPSTHISNNSGCDNFSLHHLKVKEDQCADLHGAHVIDGPMLVTGATIKPLQSEYNSDNTDILTLKMRGHAESDTGKITCIATQCVSYQGRDLCIMHVHLQVPASVSVSGDSDEILSKYKWIAVDTSHVHHALTHVHTHTHTHGNGDGDGDKDMVIDTKVGMGTENKDNHSHSHVSPVSPVWPVCDDLEFGTGPGGAFKLGSELDACIPMEIPELGGEGWCEGRKCFALMNCRDSTSADSKQVFSATCTAGGVLTTRNNIGAILCSKVLPLKAPVSVLQTRIIENNSTLGIRNLLCVFCGDNEADAATAPFVLVLNLDSLAFLYEIRGAQRLVCGYFRPRAPLEQSLLWIPPSGSALPLLTSFPANDGVCRVLRCSDCISSSSSAPSHEWKERAAGSVIILSNITATTSSSKAKTKSEKTKKGRAKKDDSRRVTAATVTSRSSDDNGDVDGSGSGSGIIKTKKKKLIATSTATPAVPLVSAALTAKVDAFSSLASNKQQKVLTALETRLDIMQSSTCKMKQKLKHTEQQLASLQLAVTNALDGDERGMARCLKDTAQQHVPLFPQLQQQHQQIQTSITEKAAPCTSILNKNINITGGVRLCDCLCLCNEAAYTLLLIVRVVNPSVLPVFGLQAICSLASSSAPDLPSTLPLSTDLEGAGVRPPFHNIHDPAVLTTTSAVSAIVHPHQEVWLAAQVPLSPALFAAQWSSKIHADAGVSANIDDGVVINISLAWKDVQCNIPHSARTLPTTYLSQVREFCSKLLTDEARAVLEVQNKWVPSTDKGVIGATVTVHAHDMHHGHHIQPNLPEEKRGTSTKYSPYIEVRMFNGNNCSNGNIGSRSNDCVTWANEILQGWLQGRALQTKPMPASFSRWNPPSGGVRYYSYVDSLDVLIVHKSTAVSNNIGRGGVGANEAPATLVAIESWLNAVEDAQSKGRYYGNPVLVRSPPTSASTNDTASVNANMDIEVDVEKNPLLLQTIAELEEHGKAYRSRVLIPNTDTIEHNSNGCNGYLPAKVLSPLLPHTLFAQGHDQAHSHLALALLELQRQLHPYDLCTVPIVDTDIRLDLLRLASFYLFEELKIIAVAHRMQRERQLEPSVKLVFPTTNNGKSNGGSNRGSNEDPLELLFGHGDLYATSSLVSAYHDSQHRTDILMAYALESCRTVDIFRI